MKSMFVLAGVALLGILHQDYWLWSDASLLFGFIPIGLAYHLAFSLVTAGFWAVAVRFGWPEEAIADDGEPSDGRGPTR